MHSKSSVALYGNNLGWSGIVKTNPLTAQRWCEASYMHPRERSSENSNRILHSSLYLWCRRSGIDEGWSEAYSGVKEQVIHQFSHDFRLGVIILSAFICFPLHGTWWALVCNYIHFEKMFKVGQFFELDTRECLFLCFCFPVFPIVMFCITFQVFWVTTIMDSQGSEGAQIVFVWFTSLQAVF